MIGFKRKKLYSNLSPEPQPDSLLDSVSNLDALRFARTEGARLVIAKWSEDGWIEAVLNGSPGTYPLKTLKTMIHCGFVNDDNSLEFWVEDLHISRMIQWLKDAPGNGMFIDVGAATGAATIPIATKVSNGLKIIAFEPSPTARKLLEETLQRNHIQGVEIFEYAISNSIGLVDFVEYGMDPTGEIPYLPEKSSISFSGIQTDNSILIKIETKTLNQVMLERSDLKNANRIVVKIDVEGFEVEVLEGANKFIQEHRPFFSIDIHHIPGEFGSTEAWCRDFLKKFGYKFENYDHVLLAIPD